MIKIREEKESDHDSIYGVHVSAFGTTTEANLVDNLRQKARPSISLVAEENDKVVGHILFSPVSLLGYPNLKIMGLAPMAIRPVYQRQGIGSKLIHSGLQRCKHHGFIAVVVLGHPEYYPRFGFAPSSQFGINSEYEVPEEVFMVLELQPEALKGKTGKVKYHDVFRELL